MKITSKGELRGQAVPYLSLKDPEIVTIHEIAAQHNIPLKYLELPSADRETLLFSYPFSR
jgi:DNA-binding IscR family transcriptional regulator